MTEDTENIENIEDIENVEDENSDLNALPLAELITENYPTRIADKILEEFNDLPDILTNTSCAEDNCGDYYDYVKQCIADNHKVPSAVEFCERFLQDGVYTYGDVSEEDYEKFIHSEKLFAMCDS